MSDESLLRPRSAFARDSDEPAQKWPSDPSERAKAMGAAGLIGGARFGALGGRPMQKEYQAQQAAHVAVAEAAAQHSQEFIRGLLRIFRSGDTSARDKIDAYREFMVAEQFVAKNTLAHERELRKMSGEELTAYLRGKLLETLGYDPETFDLTESLDDEDVIEGTAVEEDAA